MVWDTVCCLMCHLFHLGDTHLFECPKQRLILQLCCCQHREGFWEGFFVAFIYFFLFALKSLLITAWVSLCGQMRTTTVKISQKFNVLGMSHKWSRIYSWIVLLCHHLLLADDFLLINGKAVKQHILCSGGCPYMSSFLCLKSRQREFCTLTYAWKEEINIRMMASSSDLAS